jgi:hypothetical protein
MIARGILAALAAASVLAVAVSAGANVIDGEDGRDSILRIGPQLGLSAAEIARIRKVAGHVGCLSPSPSVGTGTLFLTAGQVVTAAHILYERDGTQRSKCFFRNQEPEPLTIGLVIGGGNAAFGAIPPRAGSNQDFAVVRLETPVPDAEPLAVDDAVPVRAGDRLIEIAAHPVGMERDVDPGIPVAQGCTVRRVPRTAEATSFFRTDCDASGSSSGSIHLSRIGGRLVLRGITITTGPWQDARFHGAPYDESGGSVTTALGVDAAVLDAGRWLAANRP